ncbi:MAG: SDR family NAD(P)-dependent oxidoreductase, partial [Actinomycetota bacterium]|nr:SDR family NAD(P)-dependent oxidoreductase [Actinomycetota bacterium]
DAHRRGAVVIASGRNEAELESLAEDLGERVEVAPADLSQPGEPRRLVERAGEVDVLVACAALPAAGYLTDIGYDSIDNAIDVNIRAPVHLTRAVLPQMRERDSGQLVFLSSLMGKMPSRAGSLYCASKSAVRTFAAAVREDLVDTGVGVTMAAPGPIAGDGSFARSGAALPRWVRLPTCERVAEKILSAVERDTAEIEPAPLFMRWGGWWTGMMPGTVAAVGRRVWTPQVAERIAESNRGRF